MSTKAGELHLPETDFLDALDEGNQRATRPAEMGRDETVAVEAR